MGTDQVLITIGALFLLGLATDLVARRTVLPRVTLLIVVGIAVGPPGLGLLPEGATVWFTLIAQMALVMVGFLLGGELNLASLREQESEVLIISLVVVVVTAAVVGGGLLLLGFPLELALILAAVATATDPAAVTEVVREMRARGPFSRLLLRVVAIDDLWGLIAFSLLLAVVLAVKAPGGAFAILVFGARELLGAIILGAALGVPMALLTGRIRPGEPTLAEALGGVLLCGGLALQFEVSFLIASMTMGFVVANLARHHRRAFRAIEGIEWPFMILFFVLSGASLDLASLPQIGVLGLAYVLLRVVARIAGGRLGSSLAGSDARTRKQVGLALLPQAGVALGIALVAAEKLQEYRSLLISTVIAATVIFELVGPIFTRAALRAFPEEREGTQHVRPNSRRNEKPRR